MYITRNISDLLHKTSILAKEYYILKEGALVALLWQYIWDIWCNEDNKFSRYSVKTQNTTTFYSLV